MVTPALRLEPASVKTKTKTKQKNHMVIVQNLHTENFYSIKLFYYIDTDEIPEFFLLLKNHIFIAHREDTEDTIFIFHV